MNKKCTFISFVAVRMWSKGNTAENGEQKASPSRQCSLHRLVLVKGFFVNNNVRKLEHPPYSPNLAPAGFHSFPQLNSALKVRQFCDAADIVKNGTEGLSRLSQNGFQECFQHFYNPIKLCRLYTTNNGCQL